MLVPGKKYLVRVRAMNLNGATCNGEAVLAVPVPKEPLRQEGLDAYGTPGAGGAGQAAMSDPRRQLPAVDALLAELPVAALLATHPRALVVRAVRDTIEAARAGGGAAPPEGWGSAVVTRAGRLAAPALASVINATGVVLHTNLGRAVLARRAADALARVATGYVALEYDLDRGARGSRHLLCRDLLVELTGAEDALVVNNAAAALLLALSALARGG